MYKAEVYANIMVQEGFTVFPCNGIPNITGKGEKAPTVNNWRKHETTDETIEQIKHTQCYGIVIPKHVIVVDVDIYKEGAEGSLQLLLNRYYMNAETCKVRTPRGGIHYYFINTDETLIRKKHLDFPGVDFLGYGCYVIGVGSVTSDGVYTNI